MSTFTENIKRTLFVLKNKVLSPYYSRFPMQRANKVFQKRFKRDIDWQDPKDLNEKINWLKFHADPAVWADLADKYKVREYVAEKGLSDILIPLYGKWNDVDSLMKDWDSLPDEFVLKSNNGCAHVIIASKERGIKDTLNKDEVKKEIRSWLKEKKYGIHNVELHYQLIRNCILAEKYLSDPGTKGISHSIIDYKIWCFDGEPFGCLVVYDRKGESDYALDYYDINWNQHSDFLCGKHKRSVPLPKPDNWDEMVNAAKILSEGHPQVRVDLYNINGKVYFGELTFTSLAGFMTYFTQEALLEMGEKVPINKDLPYNRFVHHI